MCLGRIKWWRMSLFTPEEREKTAGHVSRLLSNDDRIDGIVIVADDEELPAVAADWVENLYELLPVLHHFETAFGETLVLGLLLENLLELDLAFDQADLFSIWSPARVVFDRSGHVTDAANAPAQAELHTAYRAVEAGVSLDGV